MRRYNHKLLALAVVASVAVAACTDDDMPEFQVTKPAAIAELEYLNDYAPLKSYVDRTANPNFKLGAGVTVSNYLQKGVEYQMAVSNFDEVTAGNAMKYASCVDNKGAMDFSTVESFVSAAKAAGQTIYGHTLAWHSQQNNTYLNSIIADRPIEGGEDNRVLGVHAGDASAYIWDYEIYYDLDQPLEVGTTYTLKLRIKGSNPGSFNFWPGMKDGTNTHYGFGGFNSGANWLDNTIVFTPESSIDRLRFCFGLLGGDLYFDDVVLTAEGSEENMVVNSSFDGDDITHWTKVSWVAVNYAIETISEAGTAMVNEYIYQNDFSGGDVPDGWGNNSTREIVAGAGPGGSAALKVTNPSVTNFWSAQMAVDFSTPFTNGETYFISYKVKASGAGKLRCGFQVTSDYSSAGDFSNVELTEEWQEVTLSTTCTKDGGTRLIFSFGDFAGDIYIDDFNFYIQKSSNVAPLTPEEKKDTLTWALDNWITGMMNACGGYVTVWDAVNEALSGMDADGDGFYDLQSATRGTVSETDAAQSFYWQDYLGDLDYVRTTVKLARQRFAESGGNAADLKLFINDYNLESDWDDNKKLRSLIHWIEQWEADGVTKIDGIGTQMHVSYYLDEATQKSKEEHVRQMFQLMAQTGKLIKISELDMGIIDANGNDITTADVTLEQQQKMAEYYEFIIKSYFELIPAGQRYGITQWAPTHSPANSGWRAGLPIGLWTLDYNRAPQYEGYVNGLQGSAGK